MGGGSGPSSRVTGSVTDNLTQVATKFPVSPAGYVGNGRRRGKVIQHHTTNPAVSAQNLFKMLSKGGKLVHSNDGRMITAKFSDGSRVVLRPISGSDGSPVVEVYNPAPNAKLPPRQKIHFMKEPS